METKKLFAVTDIHGFYTQMKDALDKAGFDSENENHVFVCCGDCFDRGQENAKVFSYIKSLPRKILIRGNHEDMTKRTIISGEFGLSEEYNGTVDTLMELVGCGIYGLSHALAEPEEHPILTELCDFFDGMRDYYETEKYIFTHAWIPVCKDKPEPSFRNDWRDASPYDWEIARWTEWSKAYKSGLTVPGKTIICGHRPSKYAYEFDKSRDPEDPSAFFGDGVIALDALTVRSGVCNVAVLEDNINTEDLM